MSGSKVVRKYESDDDGDVLCDVGSMCLTVMAGVCIFLDINIAFLLIMGISVYHSLASPFISLLLLLLLIFIARHFIDVSSSFHLRCGVASSSSSSSQSRQNVLLRLLSI